MNGLPQRGHGRPEHTLTSKDARKTFPDCGSHDPIRSRCAMADCEINIPKLDECYLATPECGQNPVSSPMESRSAFLRGQTIRTKNPGIFCRDLPSNHCN